MCEGGDLRDFHQTLATQYFSRRQEEWLDGGVGEGREDSLTKQRQHGLSTGGHIGFNDQKTLGRVC